MILPADVVPESVAGSRSIDFEPVGSSHVSANADELPHGFASNIMCPISLMVIAPTALRHRGPSPPMTRLDTIERRMRSIIFSSSSSPRQLFAGLSLLASDHCH